MSKIITDNQYYIDIADTIREKTNSEDTYQPADMAEGVQKVYDAGVIAGRNQETTIFDFDETYVIAEEDIVDGKYARTTDSHGDPISLSEMQVDFTIPAGSNTGITYLYFYHTSNGTPTNMRVSEFPYQHATKVRRHRTLCYKIRDSFYRIDGYGWTEGDSYTALQHTDGTRMNCGVFFDNPTPLLGFYFNVADGMPVAGTEIRVRGRKTG